MKPPSRGDRPNILFFIPHDLGDHLCCYGHPTVRSPHLDRLAAEGVQFQHCYGTAPECTPSRAGLFSGYYDHQNGLMGLSNFGWRLNPETPHLAKRLRDAGYETHLFGLQHETGGDPGELGYAHVSPGNRRAPEVCELLGEFLRSDAARGETPWFACAGFFNVHRKWPEETTFSPDEVDVPPYLPDNPTVRNDLAHFHQDIEDMDTAVGVALEALRASGLDEDTLVVFTTDHGCGFPRAKATFYDPGIHVPLIMRWAGRTDSGVRPDALISNLDVTPTLLELAGAEIPADMEGRSLLPLARGDACTDRGTVFGALFYDVAYDPMHMVRTRAHKYIRSFAVTDEDAAGADPRVVSTFTAGQWVRCDDFDVMAGAAWRSMASPQPRPPREELYDLDDDPLEQKNLADDPASAEVLADMRRRLAGMMERTRSPLLSGHVPPTPKQVEANAHYGYPLDSTTPYM